MLLEKEKIGLILASVASNFAPWNGKTSFLLMSLTLVIKGKLRVLQKKVNTNLKSVNAQVLQQVLKSLDMAFADMNKKKLGFPRFKNKYRRRSSVYPQLGKNVIQDNYINSSRVCKVHKIEKNSRGISS